MEHTWVVHQCFSFRLADVLVFVPYMSSCWVLFVHSKRFSLNKFEMLFFVWRTQHSSGGRTYTYRLNGWILVKFVYVFVCIGHWVCDCDCDVSWLLFMLRRIGSISYFLCSFVLSLNWAKRQLHSITLKKSVYFSLCCHLFSNFRCTSALFSYFRISNNIFYLYLHTRFLLKLMFGLV